MPSVETKFLNLLELPPVAKNIIFSKGGDGPSINVPFVDEKGNVIWPGTRIGPGMAWSGEVQLLDFGNLSDKIFWQVEKLIINDFYFYCTDTSVSENCTVIIGYLDSAANPVMEQMHEIRSGSGLHQFEYELSPLGLAAFVLYYPLGIDEEKSADVNISFLPLVQFKVETEEEPMPDIRPRVPVQTTNTAHIYCC